MGDLISQPIYGNDCGFLTPGVFPVGETPKNMLCTLFDIVPCPLAGGDSAPNGSCKIVQGANCIWDGDIQGKTIRYQQGAVNTVLTAFEVLDQWFLDTVAGFGEDEFTSDLLACGGAFDFGILGTAQVSLEPYEANSYELASTFNFVDPSETYYSEFMISSASPFTSVTRLSSHRWNTNILIKRER